MLEKISGTVIFRLMKYALLKKEMSNEVEFEFKKVTAFEGYLLAFGYGCMEKLITIDILFEF